MNESKRHCHSCNTFLTEGLTPQKVLVDFCPSCRGVWLDDGEINFLVKNRKTLFQFYSSGLNDSQKTDHACPTGCGGKLFTGKLPGVNTSAEHCPVCKGLWLAEQAFRQLEYGLPLRTPEKSAAAMSSPQLRTRLIQTLPALPSLGMISIFSMAGLYALLFGILVFLSELGLLPRDTFAWVLGGILIVQFIFGPVILDISLRYLGSLDWIEVEDLPESAGKFCVELCEQEKIPLPKFGIIRDLAPNAFTYGRTPWSARLVLSRGVLERLTADELKAVIAHEIGHITHWDFVVMTAAQFVPIVLYHLYRLLKKTAGKGTQKKGKSQALAVAVVVYLAYVISEYLVLFVSRVREYWADRFSGTVTGNPNLLSTALLKIAYGLAAQQPDDTSPAEAGQWRRAFQAMGISENDQSQALALYAAPSSAAETPRDTETIAQELMQWDLWNPWASVLEFSSTHPLIAKRITRLSQQSAAMGIPPKITFDLRKPESYWDEFLVDIFFYSLPFACAGAALLYELSRAPIQTLFWPPVVLGFALGGLARHFFTYRAGGALPSSIGALLRQVKVSPIRGIPVAVKGKLLGKGIPGYLLSEDFILQDRTGLIFLDYTQPLGIFELFFAVLRSNQYTGKEVEVIGWYRRAPIPYIELRSIRTTDGGLNSKSFTMDAKLLFWIGLTAATLYSFHVLR